MGRNSSTTQDAAWLRSQIEVGSSFISTQHGHKLRPSLTLHFSFLVSKMGVKVISFPQ